MTKSRPLLPGTRLLTLIALLSATSAGAATLPQEPSSTAAALHAKAVQAYQTKDYAQFLVLEKQALALDPTNAKFLYNIASVEALESNAAEAVTMLDRLLAEKLDFGAETDPDFAKIRNTPEWRGFLTRLADLRKPVVRSQVAFKLDDPNFIATGIAADPATGDIYVASVRERKIARRTAAGALSDFIRQAQDGFLAGDSLAIDSARGLLYASTSAVPYMIGYRAEDFGRTGVFAFDLKSGKLMKKAMLPGDGKRHLLNALAIDRDGNVYVSDTGASGIYLLKRDSSELQTF